MRLRYRPASFDIQRPAVADEEQTLIAASDDGEYNKLV
jgi:hypothetical protein